VLADVHRRQVEAEHLRPPPDIAQPPVGQRGQPRAAQARVDEIEIGAVVARIGVAALGAGAGGVQAGQHEPQLLPDHLVRRARPGARRHLRQAGPVDLERALQLRHRAGAPHRDGQLAPERLDVGHVAGEDELALPLERAAGHVGGDVRVAVAIAADPGAPAQERADLERLARPGRRQRVLQLAVDQRRHVEERGLEHLQPGPHLVARRRPGGARLLGHVQRQHHLAQPIARVRALARARAGIVELFERAGDLRQQIDHRAAPRLGRVGGQDRHHEQPLEQRAHLVGADSGPGHLGAGGGQRAVGRRVGAVAAAEDADPVLLLGRVEQVEEQRERARDQLERVEIELGVAGSEALAPALELAGAQPDGVALDPLHQRQPGLARARPHGLGQELVEELKIRQQLVSQLVRHAGG
jgi:hypothetical protein